MSIDNLGNLGFNPVDPYKNDGVHESSPIEGEEAAGRQEDAQRSKSGDRVEISEAGRAAHAHDAARTREIELGRSALHELAPSEEQLDKIRERVQEGHYNKPSTIKDVAERMANDLNQT